jgi:hypothetical protein
MRISYNNIMRKYMDGWLTNNLEQILDVCHPNIYIEECHGPAYLGIAEVEKWISAWVVKGQVTKWEILIDWYDENEDTYFYKWHFCCNYNNEIRDFQGLSLVKMEDEKIVRLEEYQTTTGHYRKYQE